VNTIKIPFDKVDRAIADGETDGFLKIMHKTGSDQILGATIVARHAGEMISEITTAIVGKLGLNKLSTVIHPYSPLFSRRKAPRFSISCTIATAWAIPSSA
jgi:pyruvate/2-oxoglutarate dehydrogenase complex dihydrolipoamide dehydrogenase (E3) component